MPDRKGEGVPGLPTTLVRLEQVAVMLASD